MSDGIIFGLHYGIIDTATGYLNTDRIKEAMDQEQIRPLIITKFNKSDFANGIEEVAKEHMEQLGCIPNYVLMHTPLNNYNENLFAFKKLKELFPTASIGISNFDLVATQYLVENNCVPDLVQIEYHPLFQPKKLVEYCHKKNIVVTAYRPFCKGELLNHPTILDLSVKYIIKPSHLILQWLSSKNIIPIVASNNPNNITSNQNFNNVTANPEAFTVLDNMDLGHNGSSCMIKFCKFCTDEPIV
jgi:diketogulonate reductase-like aldo/keto reductase